MQCEHMPLLASQMVCLPVERYFAVISDVTPQSILHTLLWTPCQRDQKDDECLLSRFNCVDAARLSKRATIP